MDAVFCSQGGDFQNEVIWSYRTGGATKDRWAKKHDVILFYVKGKTWTFHAEKDKSFQSHKYGYKNVPYFIDEETGKQYRFAIARDVIELTMGTGTKERLGYPTQKPEGLLDKLIAASSNEGDVVLDAYCGCGTTAVVAQRLKREWIGIDITYQSISLVLRRLEKAFGTTVLDSIKIDGIPRDMASAQALAHKQDDRLRKEFEKWAVLTYTNNRAVINEKKGADAGIDARAYFMTGKDDNAKVIFQVKSGGVKRGDIATLRGDMGRENAALAVLITLEDPSKPMVNEAKAAGQYRHETMGRDYDQIGIITVQEILDGKRLDIPMSLDVLKAAQEAAKDQDALPF
jgi:site-specific DNA-methyltransferase (adenine-specific)